VSEEFLRRIFASSLVVSPVRGAVSRSCVCVARPSHSFNTFVFSAAAAGAFVTHRMDAIPHLTRELFMDISESLGKSSLACNLLWSTIAAVQQSCYISLYDHKRSQVVRLMSNQLVFGFQADGKSPMLKEACELPLSRASSILSTAVLAATSRRAAEASAADRGQAFRAPRDAADTIVVWQPPSIQDLIGCHGEWFSGFFSTVFFSLGL
jgi:hypothetical protein